MLDILLSVWIKAKHVINVWIQFHLEGVADKDIIELKNVFVASISHGGLFKPSDYIFDSGVHALALLKYVLHDDNHLNSDWYSESKTYIWVSCMEEMYWSFKKFKEFKVGTADKEVTGQLFISKSSFETPNLLFDTSNLD